MSGDPKSRVYGLRGSYTVSRDAGSLRQPFAQARKALWPKGVMRYLRRYAKCNLWPVERVNVDAPTPPDCLACTAADR